MALTEGASIQLETFKASLPQLQCSPVASSLLTPALASDNTALVCAHVCDEASFSLIASLVPVGVPLVLTGRHLGRGRLLRRPHKTHDLHHRAVGGLTTARLTVCISGPGTPFEDAFSARVAPRRPLAAFLEPAVRLAAWRKHQPAARDCWYPASPDAKPFPWPWRGSPTWVETSSVFFKDHMIQRPFTHKEQAQLWDLRMDWEYLLPLLLSWCDGAAPPIRLIVEGLFACLPWLVSVFDTVSRKKILDNVDWGRERAPWLGELNSRVPGTQLERLAYFGWVWEPGDAAAVTVAARADGSGVDLSLWAVGGAAPHMEQARQTLRAWLHRTWMRRLYLEATRWLSTPEAAPEFVHNRAAIMDCLERALWSSWWEWTDGSRLAFWRWPPVWRVEARDGAYPMHLHQPRRRLHFPPVRVAEEWMQEMDNDKMRKLIRRRYIATGAVNLVIPRFPVVKVAGGPDERDIRVVWHAKMNGLNDSVFTPSFFLPTVATYLRRIEAGMPAGDFDVGEQFHNFGLHPSERPFHGVDVPQDLVDEFLSTDDPFDRALAVSGFMRWERLCFGWQSSPYFALRMFARALEYAQGSPNEPGSAFCWDRVVLNLPCSPTYDPSRPRVMRITAAGKVAAALVAFFDDGRVAAHCTEHTERALRQICARLQHLMIQDAARKRRSVSLRPGAWAGAVVFGDQGILRALISQKKWDKGKRILAVMLEELDTLGRFPRKRFRSEKGFLMHLATCYDFMWPYLKSFHLSEECWRPNRDAEGWKVSRSSQDPGEEEDYTDDLELLAALEEKPDLQAWVEDMAAETAQSTDDPPEFVKPVPRLRRDLEALNAFFDHPTPVQVIVRPVGGAYFVSYGGGDASGEGFGSRIARQIAGLQPSLRQGFWCTEASEQSSNWRELRNLVNGVKVESRAGRLVGCELWLGTDNKVAADCWHKGSSDSQTLFDLVLELKLESLHGNFVVKLFHMAGTRMIQTGIDGLSRGEFQLGQLTSPTATEIPMYRSPIDRSPAMLDWLGEWLPQGFKVAEPADWFWSAQQAGQYSLPESKEVWIWELPPAAAIDALEELAQGRFKRHYLLTGVVLIPNFLETEWRRRFVKVVDFYFTIPAGAIPAWPSDMHEPLTVGVYLPLLRYEPWDWKHVPLVAAFGTSLSAMYKAHEPSAGDYLRELWAACAWIAGMPRSVVRDLLQGTSWRRFLGLARSYRRGRG